jgi:isoaspartyl dipeptidase IadA
MYLFKNATVYAPEKLGIRDVLVIDNRIVAMEESLTVSLPGLEVVDAKGLIMTPGLIDQHIHVTGGGGEAGPTTRVPEVVLSRLVESGTTTVVGVAGTDSVTRSMPNLLAKVRALAAEGISTWMYTSNYALPPSLLTDSIRNDLFFVPEVLGVKIAHSDHRSSFPTMDEMMRILSDVRVGGMISGKVGVLHVHLGVLDGAFDVFNEIVSRGMPIKHIRPTHCGRSRKQFDEAAAFSKQGGVVDFTSGGGCFTNFEEVIKLAIQHADMNNVTMSTDGNGSIPRFDAQGNMIGLGMGSASSNLDMMKSVVTGHDIPLEKVLPMVTSNVARHLELKGKGEIAVGKDADLCFFNKDIELQHVVAKGRFLMRNKDVIVKGTFEE